VEACCHTLPPEQTTAGQDRCRRPWLLMIYTVNTAGRTASWERSEMHHEMEGVSCTYFIVNWPSEWVDDSLRGRFVSPNRARHFGTNVSMWIYSGWRPMPWAIRSLILSLDILLV
jgi:hypothetical protein